MSVNGSKSRFFKNGVNNIPYIVVKQNITYYILTGFINKIVILFGGRMIQNLIMFTKADDLEELTGLTHDELWDHGFNLDDMDVGFVSNQPLHTAKDEYDWLESDDYSWLINAMNNYCVGAMHTEYKDKHYYTVHHA